jgi:dihydropteroate synthase
MNSIPIQRTLSARGKLLHLDSPIVMGILNATPNSFYNQGKDSDVVGLMRTAHTMVKDGAQILDIGGASTKPGEPIIAIQQELDNILPVIEAVRKAYPAIWISVDTYHARTAEVAVAHGSDLINDVSGGHISEDMLPTMAKLKVPYVAMHMQGVPEHMQQNPQYNDVILEVYDYLKQIITDCAALGLHDVIIDPGFGFGKTLAHNYQLLNHLGVFRSLGRPILAGISRKSMIWKPLGTNASLALNGTTALHMIALQQGASILRVHDVAEAQECIALFNMLQNNK